MDAAGPPLDAAERIYADAVDEPFEPSAGRAASLLVNVPAMIALERASLAHLRGDAEGTAASASRALAAIGEGEWMLDSVTRWHLAVAEWLRGRVPEAERAFACRHRPVAGGRRAHPGRLGRPLPRPGPACPGPPGRGARHLPAGAGDHRTAWPVGPACRWDRLQVGLGEVAYQRNELDTALRHVTEGIALCRQFAYTQPLATGLAALAWIRQAHGDPAGALEAMGEAGRAAPGPA